LKVDSEEMARERKRLIPERCDRTVHGVIWFHDLY
jgi:hypothetical protein